MTEKGKALRKVYTIAIIIYMIVTLVISPIALMNVVDSHGKLISVPLLLLLREYFRIVLIISAPTAITITLFTMIVSFAIDASYE